MKNIGIFGEYEEKHQRLLDNLAMYQTMKQFIESLGQYPEDAGHDEYTEQMMQSLFEIISRYADDAVACQVTVQHGPEKNCPGLILASIDGTCMCVCVCVRARA